MRRIYLLSLPLVVILLEFLPYGAVCVFSNGEGGIIRETFSYFSLIPFGNACFSPLLTAVFTCVLSAILILHLILKKRRLLIFSEFISWICASLSLCPLLYGIGFYSAFGGVISLLLIFEAVILHAYNKKSLFGEK